MNLDYKQKYLKYKNKYLFTKSLKGGVLTSDQQAIVKKITEGFVSEKNLDTHNIQHYMDVIGKNATSLTQEKIELLFKWSVMDEKEAPTCFRFVTTFDKQIESIKQQLYNSADNEENNEFFEKQLEELNKSHAVEIEKMKKILYNKLLSTIFDDDVTIEQFTKLANQRIE
jgi:hypothetical protein